LNLLDILSKNTRISNFLKIRPVGAELFHTDSRTDTTKLVVVFRNFANVPKESGNDITQTRPYYGSISLPISFTKFTNPLKLHCRTANDVTHAAVLKSRGNEGQRGKSGRHLLHGERRNPHSAVLSSALKKTIQLAWAPRWRSWWRQCAGSIPVGYNSNFSLT
jgi:hypothetical protein